MVVEKAREMVEPFCDESKRRKSLAIGITRSPFVETRIIAHADEQTMVHGTRCEARQRYRSFQVAQTRHPRGLMAYRGRNVGIRLAPSHLVASRSTSLAFLSRPDDTRRSPTF